MALAHAQLSDRIIAAFYQVYRELGHGYSEKIYRRALAIVLREMDFHVIEECEMKVRFHGVVIGVFQADLVVDGKILVEIKACEHIEDWHIAQILNYLNECGGRHRSTGQLRSSDDVQALRDGRS